MPALTCLQLKSSSLTNLQSPFPNQIAGRSQVTSAAMHFLPCPSPSVGLLAILILPFAGANQTIEQPQPKHPFHAFDPA